MNNTNKKTDITYREMFRKKTGEEKLLMGFSMFRFSTTILLSSFKDNISSKDLRKSIFLKIYGSDFDRETLNKILTAIFP